VHEREHHPAERDWQDEHCIFVPFITGQNGEHQI
jgi:hypothetical protein